MAEQHVDLTEARVRLQKLADLAKRKSSVQLPLGFVKAGSGDPPLARPETVPDVRDESDQGPSRYEAPSRRRGGSSTGTAGPAE
jgi:hypothetical protein